VRQLFDRAECHLGALDILDNNASVVVVTPSVAEATEQAYDRIMAVNAKGTSSPFQQATRRLRDGDRIINISTVNTVLPVPRGGELSAASKAPVQQATLVAARELADPGSPSTPSPRAVR
jgi:3-oxoacyl-[acyl-carrier protein] reductase